MGHLREIVHNKFNMEKDFKHEMKEVDTNLNKVERPSLSSLMGHFQTVSVAPTVVPGSFQNQIQIYSNGATYRLYWYDTTNNAWRYATGA